MLDRDGEVVAAQLMRAPDHPSQQTRHAFLGAVVATEVEHARDRDRAMLIAADTTPLLAHIAAAIPQTAACAYASRFFEHNVVSPSVNALPPIQLRIAGRLRTLAPEAFVEHIFEKLGAVRAEQIHSGVSAIDECGARRKILASHWADRAIVIGSPIGGVFPGRKWEGPPR